MSISIHLSAFAAKGRAIFSASKSSEAEGLLACGIREIDDLLEGGFPKAGLTEIMVPASRPKETSGFFSCRRTLRPSASGPSGITSFSILQKRFSLTRQSLPSVHCLRMSPIVRP